MLTGYRITLFAIAGCLAASTAAAGTLVRKCQDADGHWYYYGQRTPEGCAGSVIYVLDENARIVDHENPPLTPEELAARAETEAALEASEAQRSDDQALVRLHGSVDLLRSTRDRKLNALERKIRTTEQIRGGLAEDLEELHARERTDEIREEIEYREQLMTEHSHVIERSEKEYKRVAEEYADLERRYLAASDRLRQGGS